MPDYVLNRLGPLEIPGIGARHVRVYVPPRDRRRGSSPVLYMFDGQNVFHDEPSFAGGWHLHATAHRMAKRCARAPVIVGVDHGGVARIQELTPWGGKADALVDWMAGTLAPAIEREFHVSREPRDVGIGGSSMGGLAALYAHLRSPEHFGLALGMSPSVWIAGGRLLHVDAGALEAKGSILAAARRLAEILRARGWDDRSLRFVEARRGQHSEKHWRRRAPKALEFLFGPR
jgi:hypothetical protein